MRMSQSAKMIWSTSACYFCPRTDVRTCQLKTNLISKIETALEVDASDLLKAQSICTCCFADIDMIIRAVSIRGAMKQYFLDYISAGSPECKPSNNETQDVSSYLQLVSNRPKTPLQSCNLNDAIPDDHEQKESVSSPQPSPPALTAMPSLHASNNNSKKKRKLHTVMYRCLLCNKVAGSKSHCMEHLIRHSSVRPFSCTKCTKTYKSRKACREHLMVMHNLKNQESEIHKAILVDQAGFNELEYICTQYTQIYTSNREATMNGSTLYTAPPPTVQVKSEPTTDSPSAANLCMPDAGASEDTESIRVTPIPLPSLQRAPTHVPSVIDGQPPTKRGRKGTPHKLTEDSDIPIVPDLNTPVTGTITKKNRSDTNSGLAFGELRISRRGLPPCNVCGRCFPTREKMTDHMRSHSEIKQFSCLVCHKYFKYRRGVTNHLKEVHRYKNRAEINSMVFTHNFEMQRGSTVLSEDLPPISFGDKTQIPFDQSSDTMASCDVSHGRTSPDVISQQVIEDTICTLIEPTSDDDSNQLSDSLHSDLHAEEETLTCIECSKPFKETAELQQHMKCHFREKHSCGVCHKRFLFESSLMSHMDVAHV